MNKRESFTNRLGFILACIGSAVGMGNIWMFPTRVSLYGGGSYLIPYFIFVVLIASTGVIGEMSFGRGTRSGPIDAFGAACESRGKRKVGETLGFIPVLGSLAMAIGYTVVMGWILKYMIGTFTGSTLAPDNVDSFAASFGGMASAFGNNLWQIIALVIAVVILMFGVGNGIEKANKIMMPVDRCDDICGTTDQASYSSGNHSSIPYSTCNQIQVRQPQPDASSSAMRLTPPQS